MIFSKFISSHQMDAFGSNPQNGNTFYFAKKCHFQEICPHSGNFRDIKFPLHDLLQGRVWEPSKKSFSQNCAFG